MYIFDTCSFITLEYRYPQKNFPSIWEKFDSLIQQGKIISSEIVYKEIMNGKDIVKKYAKNNKDIFIPLDIEIQQEAKAITNAYTTILNFKKAKSGADPFIIALAKLKNGIVVTEERPTGNTNPIKIPDVCKILKIECIPLLHVIKKEKIIV